MSLIVVEGPDGSGKTTLIAALRRRSPKYFWGVRASRNPGSFSNLVNACSWLNVAALHSAPLVVTDRHPLVSEPIYATVLRRPALATPGWFKEKWQTDLHCITCLIYCKPPRLVIAENLLKGGQQLVGVPENISTIIDLYDGLISELIDEYGIKVRYYDYLSSNPADFQDTFEEFFDEE